MAEPLCPCGKPASHLTADPDSSEWGCRVPVAESPVTPRRFRKKPVETVAEWTPAEERAAKAAHAVYANYVPGGLPYDEVPETFRDQWRELARAALSAAAEGELEYQWGVRNPHRDHVIPCESEKQGRYTNEVSKRGSDGEYVLVRRKVGPWEVVDE